MSLFTQQAWLEMLGVMGRSFIAVFLAIMTLGNGILNLTFLMGRPSLPRALVPLFPLAFISMSRTLSILIGLALIVSSFSICKRKKRAWGIVLAVSWFSAIFQLIWLHEEVALLSLALFLLLLFALTLFTVNSGRPDLRSSLLLILVSALIAIGYGTAGFWLLDGRHFGIDFHTGDAVATAFRFLSLSGDPRLVPQTQCGHLFLDALYMITFTAGAFSGLALFPPRLYQFRSVRRERIRATEIVEQYARSPLDVFKLPDKSYFFSLSGRCVIAYRVANNIAIALGDPVGPEAEIEPTVCQFLQMCRENGWGLAFYQTLPDFVPVYCRLRLKKLKIGDDALVDLQEFSLEGKSKRELRSKVHQLEEMGIHVLEYQPPVPESIIAQLKTVSDQWLEIPGRRERSFTLGHFDPDYLRSTPVLAVVDTAGSMLAFINLISVNRNEITGDLMRRRTDVPNGIMDYLFIKLFQYARERGYARVSLGMAPMTGFQEHEQATVVERAINGLFQKLDFLFSFRGLHHYKAKFATSWEPRYLIYRNIMQLPRIALALRRVSEIRKDKDEGGAGEEAQT
jgi:phosphatidylglycerol lysyltransferase